MKASRVYVFALLIAAVGFAIPGTVFGGGACSGDCDFIEGIYVYNGECGLDEEPDGECGCTYNGAWQTQSRCGEPV